MGSKAVLRLPPPSGAIVTIAVPASQWYRVHSFNPKTQQYLPNIFNANKQGNARFSPLMNAQEVIPTLYLGASQRTAIAEVVLRNVPVPSAGYLHDLTRDLQSDLHLSVLQAPSLKLANLTSVGMTAAGLPPYALVDGGHERYACTRKWAQWIWQTHSQIQGLFWMSRRYNRESVIMLFGDRIGSDELVTVSSHPIAEYKQSIIDVLAEMGAGVTPDL